MHAFLCSDFHCTRDPFPFSILDTHDPIYVRRKIVQLLHQIGMRPHYKGYQCAVHALYQLLQTPDLLTNLTRNLYPLLAQLCQATPVQVDHNLRNAIQITWAGVHSTGLQKLFPQYLSCKCPTNAVFLSTLYSTLSIYFMGNRSA